MAYGLKYIASYDTISGLSGLVEIYQKDYTDIVYPLELSAEPVVQKYQATEASPAISGCSLSLNICNTGTLPITAFYSESDNFFKIKHYLDGQITFEGFLVMDNCQELMVDYRHELNLSFTDNLGLLKDVALDNTDFQTPYVYDSAGFALGAPNGVIISDTNYIVEIGVPFIISGTTFDGTYTPVSIVFGSGFYTVTVAETVTTHAAEFGFLSVIKDMDYYGYNNLLSIIQACLINTGLELNTTVYTRLFEQSHTIENSFLQQTYVNTQMFLGNENFDSCWDVLEKIFNRFNLSLFQHNGMWCIARFNELRYGTINGYVYDFNFNLTGTDIFNSEYLFGFEQPSYPINVSALKAITRPYKYTKDTFNYQQPKYLLKNYDLLKLGMLLRTYTTGSGINLKTYYEYVAIGWTAWFGSGVSPGVFIRIVNDYVGNEIDRCLVIKGDSGDSARAVVGVPFEVSATDRVQLNYTFSVNLNVPGVATNILALMITDGTTTSYADEDTATNWKSGIGWNYQFASGYDADVVQSVEIKTGQIPFDALFYVYLPISRPQGNSNYETVIRDIRITYIPAINLSTKVIGHTHTQTQPPDIKNNNEKTIFIDDSIRRSIVGALFLSGYTGLLRQLTTKWYRYNVSTSERFKLGYITTLDELGLFRTPRATIEGDFKGIQFKSPLGMIMYSPYNSLRFIAGTLELFFKSDAFNCVMYEVGYNESDSLIDNTYNFDYIYDTK